MDLTVRMAAGVALMAGCTMLGRGLARGQMRRVRFLECSIRGVQGMKRGMCLRKSGLREALADSGFAPFMEAGDNMEKGGNLSPEEGWEQVDTRRECMVGDRAVLDRLFAGLGSGGMETQSLLLEETLQRLKEQLEAARKHQQETVRLYPALGALSGLALALLLY